MASTKFKGAIFDLDGVVTGTARVPLGVVCEKAVIEKIKKGRIRIILPRLFHFLDNLSCHKYKVTSWFIVSKFSCMWFHL